MQNLKEYFPLPQVWFDHPDDVFVEQISPLIGTEAEYISPLAVRDFLEVTEVLGGGGQLSLCESVRTDVRQFLQMLDACDIRNLRLPINDDVEVDEYNREFHANNENVYDAEARSYYRLDWESGETAWVEMRYDTGSRQGRFIVDGEPYGVGDSRLHDIGLDTQTPGDPLLLNRIFPGWHEQMFEPFVKGWEKQIAEWRAEDEAEEEGEV